MPRMQNPYPDADDPLALPASKLPPGPPEPAADSLRAALMRALTGFGLVPLLLLGAFAGLGDYLVRLQQAQGSLRAAVTAVGADLDLFLGAHRSAVQQVALEVAEREEDEATLVRRLERTRATFPALLTMLVTDANGRVRAGSFDNRTGIDRSLWFGVDVSDRAYYQQPRETGEAAIQGVFQGRGFGNDALCAVSAPVLREDGRFDGVVQGSIRLDDLRQAFTAASHTPGMRLLIIDTEQRVAYASPELGLQVLAPAPGGVEQPLASDAPRFVRVDLPAPAGGNLLVLESRSALGWRVLALIPRGVLLERTLLDLTVVMIALVVVGGFALWAGQRMAVRLVRPIEEIGRRMDRLALASHPERFQSRSSLVELVRLESSFLRLGQRLGESYARLTDEFAKESTLRAELARARAETARAEGELDAAREIQMSMLPSRGRLAAFADRLQIAALLEPMQAVGGDFFSVRAVDARRLAFFIGDVSDKGIPAALFMARTLTLLEYAAELGEAPAETLQRVGRVLARDNAGGMFVTVLAGRIELDSGVIELASAGHELPILRPALGLAASVAMATGPALGFEEEAEFPTLCLRLEPGDALLAYTDGLTESRDSARRMFGEDRLTAALSASVGDAEARLAATLAACGAHREGSAHDDLTLLCLQRPGPTVRRLECGSDGQMALLDAQQAALIALSLPQTCIDDARLVSEELVSNAFAHGAASGVALECRVSGDRLEFCLIDDGADFDPLAQDLPCVDADLDERGIGGLGLLLVRSLAQDLRHARSGIHNLIHGWLPIAADQNDTAGEVESHGSS